MTAVELWLIDDAAAVQALVAHQLMSPIVPEVELARISRPASSAANDWRLAAHVALRLLLAGRHGPALARRPFEIAPGGKPSLHGLPLSLSHADGATLIALGPIDGPALGVDIERVRSVTIAAPRRQRIEEAAERLAGVPLPAEPPHRRFMTAWCRLEALAKRSGDGIGATLAAHGIWGPTGRRVPDAASAPAGGHQGTVLDLDVGPDHAAAIALGLPLASIEVRRLSQLLIRDAINGALQAV